MRAGILALRGGLHSAAPRLVPRDVERREVTELLLDDAVRLVTLVGAPGAGKTRLATIAAEDLEQVFVDGIVFVDLTPVQDPSLVPAAIAAALGIWEAGDREVIAGLEVVLRDRSLLLVLDNFEHLLPAAQVVGNLLTACARLKILVSSREALRLSVEHRYTVAPLAVPSELDESSPRSLERVPSVALFCLRARAVRSDWTLDDANMHAVAELCRRLDGLPLGIELAAAWIGVLSPRALLARLNVCLNAEIARPSDQPDRHRSLRAAIAWSYDLLTEHEQTVFDQLAVFSGGWDEEAATAVAAMTAETMLTTLAALAEKHLIWSAEQLADGEPRFGLLDTLHAFARTRLGARHDADEIRRRHAEHYVSLAERAERALVGPDQRIWLDRLERDVGNLRAALSWAIGANEAELALRLASALWFFWDMRGHLIEGQQWLATALGLPGEGLDQARAAALNGAGWLALVQHGAYARGIALLEQGRSAADVAGDQRGLVRAQSFLGLALALGSREQERSEQLLEAAVADGEKLGDLWAVGLALYGLGHLDVVQGKAARADERWQTCATMLEGIGNLYGQSYLQFRWGVLAFGDLDLGRASTRLRASLQMACELDSTREMAVAIAALALVAWAGGQPRRSARLAGITQAFLDRAGCYLPAFLNSEYEGTVANVRERLGPAAFARSFGAGHSLTASDAVAEALDTGEFARYLPLTAREWEVARLVARGLTNKEIGDHLVLTERTIGAHLERIFDKLRIQSRTQLAVWAAERDAPSRPLEMEGALAPVEGRVQTPSRRSRRGLRVLGA